MLLKRSTISQRTPTIICRNLFDNLLQIPSTIRDSNIDISCYDCLQGSVDDESVSDTISFFDDIKVEDPRVPELSQKSGQPAPYQILIECLKRNYGKVANVDGKLVNF